MTRDRKVKFVALLVAAFALSRVARAQLGATVENWTVPEWASRTVDLSRPVTFVAVTPCRIVDTRDPVGPYGGPALPPATTRNFDLNSGPCTGIPSEVAAYSLNITATQTQGFGDLRLWPTGATPPLVSTLNYVPNQTIANAAIVPADMNGSISIVAAVSGTHLIIDINGYFTDRPNPGNEWYFLGQEAGQLMYVYNTEGSASNAIGVWGQTNSNGFRSFGVTGFSAFAPTGDVGGVRGAANDFFGQPFYGPAGVRGESRHSFGVLGVTRDHLGVAGSNVHPVTGLEETWGALACSATSAVCGMGTLDVTGTKSFVEPHPTDASKVIKYVSLEGNEPGTYFRGRGKFERGMARIRVPEDFRMVTDPEGLSIQVTPIGEMASVAVVRIDLNEIVVKASRNVEFFYLVQGARKGYEGFAPIAREAFFAPRSANSRMPESLSREAKRKLIANGTYNEDGTVNMETAKRLGWTEKWKGSGGAPVKD
jgi:hypothetical protein